MKDTNIHNSFNGTTNFNGAVQVAGGDIINEISSSEKVEEKYKTEPKYKSEPKWRSPFTLAILTWISIIIGILGLIPGGKILINVQNVEEI